MKKIAKIILSIIAVGLIIWSVQFFRIYQTSRIDEAGSADAIAVLGAAQYAGKPSPVFQARLDHAVELYNKGYAKLIITTGGVFPGEKFSEGGVGKDYLAKRGIPAEQIISDDQSETTKQNIMRINEIAGSKNLKRIILVSDPFHMHRAMLYAKNLEFEALPSPTQTSPISKNFWLEISAMFRETFLSLLHLVLDV